ncbi:MAG: hypothetical protein WAL84_04405 [Candidatus Dormiibacterota bacterium]
MTNRKRRLAIAAAATATVVGALGSAGVGQRIVRANSSPTAVSFTSSAMVAPLVAHYTVTPAERGAAASARAALAVAGRGELPTLLPKPRASARPAVSGGVTRGANLVTASAGSATPPTSSSFIGQQGSSTTCSYFAQGCNPPDMGLGASPTFVLQGVNTQWEVLSTTGVVEPGWPVSAQNFFNVPNVTNGAAACDTAHGSQPFLSDPRALYDPTTGRFWAAMLQVEGGLGIAPDCPFKSVYFIAVSQNSDPLGSWNVYEFDMADGANFAADYTQVGFSGNAFLFSANMFGNAGGFYAEALEANKSDMEAGTANFTADGFRNIQGTGPGITSATGPFLADTLEPVQSVDGSGGGDGLFVDTVDGPDLLNGNFCSSASDACKGLILWRMSNPVAHDGGGPAPTFSGTYLPNTLPFFFSPPADQPSCNQCVDALDLRITATPVLRNDIIYAAFETGLDTGRHVTPTIEWGQIQVSGGTPSTTTGYFGFGGDTAASFGALMPDSHGNVVMLYERMGHNIFPETRYVERAVGQANFNGVGSLLKAGEASYRPTLCGTPALPVCRWGDFEATSFDGAGHIWFAGEYANSNTDPNAAPAFGRNWGTWIGAVNAS